MSGGGSRGSAGCEQAPQASDREREWLPFGVLRRPHGTRGEILLASYNPCADRSWMHALPTTVRWTKGERALDLEIAVGRAVKGGILVRFASADSREAVAELVGGEVQIARQQLPALSSGEFYVEDIAGFEVLSSDGVVLGKVRGSFWNGAHDVMCVVAADGEERFLPVQSGFILAFDAIARRLTVDPHE